MKFTLEPNQLTIQLEGWEKVWALKRRLQVPHYSIAGIDFLAQAPTLQDFKGYFRYPGTSLPWKFLAGSYVRKGQREFWYVRMRQSGMLTIFLKTGTLNYDKIRVTCTPEIAQNIADWWQEHK